MSLTLQGLAWHHAVGKLIETPLIARELEVSRLMLSGLPSKEIARRLAISAETVKVHRKYLYSMHGIKSQSKLYSLFLQAQGRRRAGASQRRSLRRYRLSPSASRASMPAQLRLIQTITLAEKLRIAWRPPKA